MKPKLMVDKAFNTLSKFLVGQKRLKYSWDKCCDECDRSTD
ncbi:MAG: hypothetical protein V7K40_00685 [Nostoc sp.]